MLYLKSNINKPVSFISAGNFIADTPWIHSKRVIDSYELMIGVHGTVYIQQEDEKYCLNEGDTLLLIPGRTHYGFERSPKGTSFYWMHFTCAEDAEIIDGGSIDDEILLRKNNPYLNNLDSKVLIPTFFTPSNLDRISILARQLLHIHMSGYYAKNATDYMLTSLLIDITEQVVRQAANSPVESKPREQLSKVLEWIRIHAAQDISLQQVAHEFNYTREYLARYFKKNMGMSIQKYIHNIRISKAKELMCQTDYNIKEIAALIGFPDEKYFMKLFKRYEDITPSAYRKAFIRTHLNNH